MNPELKKARIGQESNIHSRLIQIIEDNMRKAKITISIPEDLLKKVEYLSRMRNQSRSAFIVGYLKKHISELTEQEITNKFNAVFSNREIITEQKNSADEFNLIGNEVGQEW